MFPIKKNIKKEKLYCDSEFKRLVKAEASLRGFPSTVEFTSYLKNSMKKDKKTFKDVLFEKDKKDDKLFKL